MEFAAGRILTASAGCLALLLIYFGAERIVLAKRRRAVGLRICVAGTRGKSTVVRHLASVLRVAGYKVLAKTTGSKPVIIHPDGSEREIARPGRPSILEQKRVLGLAARMGADAVVAEMMSIRPENLRAESASIFRPGVLAVTNVRLDHLDDMGRTKDEIAAALAAAVPAGGKMFVLEEELYPAFVEAARERNAALVNIPRGAGKADGGEFPENVRLVTAIAASLGIAPDVISAGIAAARLDFGALKIWKTSAVPGGRTLFLASAFAANEPESSAIVLEALRRRHPGLPPATIALLNLRADRGDRTEQWLRALEDGFFASFERLVFVGDHARALVRRKWGRKPSKYRRPIISAVADRDPARIMAGLGALVVEDSLVVGLGNIGGAGAALVNHWARTGASL
jgi:poly-gamma-glutamate synthase PgsB/CapB